MFHSTDLYCSLVLTLMFVIVTGNANESSLENFPSATRQKSFEIQQTNISTTGMYETSAGSAKTNTSTVSNSSVAREPDICSKTTINQTYNDSSSVTNLLTGILILLCLLVIIAIADYATSLLSKRQSAQTVGQRVNPLFLNDRI